MSLNDYNMGTAMTLDDLISKFIDDRAGLSEPELDQLIAGLRAEPQRAIGLRQHLLVDDLVSQKLAFDRRNFTAQVEQRIADYERGEEDIQNQVVELRTLAESPLELAAGKTRDGVWWKISLAVAALAVLGFVTIVPYLARPSGKNLARVEAVQGTVSLQGKAGQTDLLTGQSIDSERQIVTAAGSVTLRFADQTLLEIAANSALTLAADPQSRSKLVRLERGELVADVQKQQPGRPLQFITPHAVATVLGTRLRLSVDDVATHLDVLEGRVELRRSADQQTLLVSTNESGVAAADNLALHELRWPENRAGMIFLFDGDTQNTLVRSPDQQDVLQITRLENSAQAVPSDSTSLNLASGAFHSREAGDDLLPLLKATNELSLEIVFQTVAAQPPGLQPIVALRDVAAGTPAVSMEQGANFLLAQDEGSLVVYLRLDTNGPSLKTIRLGPIEPGQQLHLALAYRSGQLIAWLNGRQLSGTSDASGSFANWQPQDLQIGGATSEQENRWRGAIAGIAIYNRCLTETEILRNRQSFLQLHAR